MSSYGGNYQTDAGLTIKSTSLNVFAVENDGTRNALGGTVRETDRGFDFPFLPSVFLQNANSASCCRLPLTRVRHVRLYFDASNYLFVPLPFRGDTTEFITFFEQLDEKNNIVKYQRYGEIVSQPFLMGAL